jgi:2-polyprenyl-3-methyl-5-hydroxy-6-metoxy-1,4-benzoquinol methylase/predicted RNA-binding Zn-ribbon protein involved in translation (DUF1610 family)
MKILDKDLQIGYRQVPTLSVLNQQMAAGSSSWRKISACPTCGDTTIGRFAKIRNIQHYRCKSCGFTFVNPLPPDDVLYVFYNSEYYLNYRRLEENRLSRDRYFSISMYTDMRRLATWLGDDKSIAILDFGCGTGAFIAFLRDELGFASVEGIEVNRESTAIAKRNFDLKLSSSKDELQHKSYDCVLLLEVIEHVPCPDILFKEIADLVKPGGRVLITTPGVDNLAGRFLPLYCKHYTALSHVSLFTRKAMTSLVSRFGFRVERFEVDEYTGILGEAFASLFYQLDYASPNNDDDVNDSLYTPNALGRFFRQETARDLPLRSLPLLSNIPIHRAGRLIHYLTKHLLGIAGNNHLYVLARKDPGLTQPVV